MSNSMFYTWVEAYRWGLAPYRIMAKLGKEMHLHPGNPWAYSRVGRSLGAGLELFERITRHYKEPEFNITTTEMNGKAMRVYQKVVLQKNFCDLVHFRKEGDPKQPVMLVVAPMSGHYATLLRGTVQGLLPHFDVYITDWHNARDVPLSKGAFHLDDFIDYCIEFMEHLGSGINIMAVCQPSVPVLSAVSIMSAEKNPHLPATMTLIGGPIDARHNPTEVNNFGVGKTLEWFRRNVITRVPGNYPGYMRQVYPGFIQLSGFMAMNMYRHVGEHLKLYYHLIEGDGESVKAHKEFYNEYLSVMDLPAEFYLDTIQAVFKEYALPTGKLVSRGRKVNPGAITKTALLAIEGEKDDISGIGQTKAALPLCSGLSGDMKKYHLQKDVGHYGLFNGRRYREFIVPVVKDFVEKHLPGESRPKKKAAK